MTKTVKPPKKPKLTKAEVRGIIRDRLEQEDWLGDKTTKTNKLIVAKALRGGCDITTSAAIARVSRKTVYEWFDKDEAFKAEAVFAREMAVKELVEICKSDTTTAWKLLKNAAKGRYSDDSGGDSGTNVQIVFNTPRPEHKIIDAKVKELPAEEEDE